MRALDARTESGSSAGGASFRGPLWTRKFEFVEFHIHSPAAKLDAFGFQAETLFETGFATELDLSPRTENALPRETDGAAQDADDLARGSGMTGGTGNRTVG